MTTITVSVQTTPTPLPAIQSGVVRVPLAVRPSTGEPLEVSDAARFTQAQRAWNDWITAECPRTSAEKR